MIVSPVFSYLFVASQIHFFGSDLVTPGFFHCTSITVLVTTVKRLIRFERFNCFLSLWCCGPTRAIVSSFMRFLDHTQRLNTLGRTLPVECSVRRWDLYLTTYNIHDRQTSMSQAEFEPTIPASKRPQTHTLDCAVWQQFIFSLLISTYMFHSLLLQKYSIFFIQHKYSFSTHTSSYCSSPPSLTSAFLTWYRLYKGVKIFRNVGN
jgi:hypothetical protein